MNTNFHYVYDKNAKPLFEINPGDTVKVETEDAFRGLIKKREDGTEETIQQINALSCPISGPVVVSGSRPGNWLEIFIEDIQIKKYGALVYGGHFSCIPDFLITHETAVASIENNFIYYSDKVKFKAKPIIGTIGTTPPLHVPYSHSQGIYGGNMDCTLICKGSTLYLPVLIEGAYLYLGDIHASQGEGELINPFESPAIVTLKINLITHKSSNNKWPRVVNDELIATICSDRTAEEAIKKALKEMLIWLEEDFGFTRHEAAVLCGQIANGRLCQILNDKHTAMCVVEKEYL